MIHLEQIQKTYRVAKKEAGILPSVRSFFRKDYETVHALTDISFDVGEGEIVGYIGPNGAGKSTTIKIMTGILVPDRGECVIDGYTPWKDRKRYVRNIGIVFGQRSQLWWDVPVVDSFELLRDIYSVPQSEYEKTLGMLNDMLDIGPLLQTPTRQLSLGQRMRCEFAAALLHMPGVLFLDEPTIGLDSVSKVAVRGFIKQVNRAFGTTVILTTHDTSDLEALTNRILLIGKGKLLLDGSLDSLLERYGGATTLVVDYGGVPLDGLDMPGIAVSRVSTGRAELLVDPAVQTVPGAIALLSERLEIKNLAIKSPSLEDMMVRLYRDFAI